jgi:hypothetical protein
MKKLLFLLILLIPIVFSAQEVVSSSIAEPALISIDYRSNYECNLSESELLNIKNFVINNFNLTDNYLVNITNSNCYLYNDYYSVYVNILAKKEISDIEFKRISFSVSSSKDINYDILMNNKADNFDYNLKNKYYSYYINNTDEEYYITFSYNYNKNYSIETFKEDLLNYFENIESEKYYQSDYDYPIIVFKSKTSELLNILPNFTTHISYYGDEVNFNFQGYSQGDYNLDLIALNPNCTITFTLSYPEFNDECYGNYVNKERIYFSINDYNKNYSIYLSLYGVKGYKAEISLSYYGDVTNEKVQEFINNALLNYFPEYSFVPNFVDYYDSKIFTDFNFEDSRFNNLNKSKDRQNTNYYDSNTYVSITEPHISIYSSSKNIYSIDAKILPPFNGQNIIITKDRVYSKIQLKQNNKNIAITGLNEMLTPLIKTVNWELNMSLRQYYYYYKGVDVSFSTSKGIMEDSLSMESVNSNSPLIAGVSETQNIVFDESKFVELEKQDTIIESIINFFTSFFK